MNSDCFLQRRKYFRFYQINFCSEIGIFYLIERLKSLSFLLKIMSVPAWIITFAIQMSIVILGGLMIRGFTKSRNSPKTENEDEKTKLELDHIEQESVNEKKPQYFITVPKNLVQAKQWKKGQDLLLVFNGKGNIEIREVE